MNLLTIPSTAEGSEESPRDRVINYLYALDSLSFPELTSLVYFVTSHSFYDVNLFFRHYYHGQWRVWSDYTGDFIEVRRINGEELIWGRETKTVLVYEGTYKNKKYYGDGILYVSLDNRGNAFDYYSPHRESDSSKESDSPNRESDSPNKESDSSNKESDSPYKESGIMMGHFENGRMEGCFDYYNARGLVSRDFYIHGRKYGLQISFFPVSEKGKAQYPLSKAIYRDNEENGEYQEFMARYFKQKGWKYNGEVDKDNTYIFEGPHICHKEGDSEKYFLSTPGMKDSLDTYTFGDEYYNGTIINLLKKGEPMRNFSTVDGDWGHVGNRPLQG